MKSETVNRALLWVTGVGLAIGLIAIVTSLTATISAGSVTSAALIWMTVAVVALVVAFSAYHSRRQRNGA